MDHVIDAPTHALDFPPSAFTALRRARAVRPGAYAATRNHLDGAVTGLSPYLTHGFIDDAALYACWKARSDPSPRQGLLSQLAWRSFFHHVWHHRGEAILEDQRPPIDGAQYRPRLPEDILTASTGVPVIDASIRTLYRSGYVHNHQRMWLASYVVHLRKVAWRTGADWMYGYLLDGDLASNHLSWQWVAGTFSAKPYLFNAENVARFAPSLASPGTAIDTSYEALGEIAASRTDVGPEQHRPAPVTPPACSGLPISLEDRVSSGIEGKPVTLVHPWSLASTGARPAVGLLCPGFHARFPWSAQRWDFVLTRMNTLCERIVVTDELPFALAGSARAIDTLNPVYHALLAGLPAGQRRDAPSALPGLATPARSYSQYMKHQSKRGWL